MFLSRRTVQTYISHILAKLGAKSRVEIVRMAMLQLCSTYTWNAQHGEHRQRRAQLARDEAAETSGEARPLDPSLMTGWKELTDAERTVAELVARGMTNKQAGRRMFSSHHTVDTHLRRVFRKLGLHSRRTARSLGEHYEAPRGSALAEGLGLRLDRSRWPRHRGESAQLSRGGSRVPRSRTEARCHGPGYGWRHESEPSTGWFSDATPPSPRPGHPFVWGCAEVCPLQAAYAVGVAFRSGHFLAGHQGYAVAEAHRLQVGEMAHCVVVSHGQEIEAACPGLGAQLSQAQCPVGVFAAPTAADSNARVQGAVRALVHQSDRAPGRGFPYP